MVLSTERRIFRNSDLYTIFIYDIVLTQTTSFYWERVSAMNYRK